MTHNIEAFNPLKDMFGSEIKIGDTILYPSHNAVVGIKVLEVTGIKVGSYEARPGQREAELHLYARPAGSDWKPARMQHPNKSVVITGTDVETAYASWKKGSVKC